MTAVDAAETRDTGTVGEAAAAPAMRDRVVRGVAWKVASGIVLQSTRAIVAVILARLLTPYEYGLAGEVLVFAPLVLLFSDLAFGVALIQRPQLSEADRSTVFWTSTAAGLLFTVGGIALSGPVADFYGQPAVQPLLAALSVSFVVTAMTSTQTALLTREMNFRALETRRMVAAAISGVVGITIAAKGGGAWAIIAQQLTVAFVSTALLWSLSSWHPHLRFSMQSLRELGGYSANVLGSRLLFYFTRNADRVLIGRFLGPSSLGAYTVATNVILLPFSQIASPVQDVAFPAFARMQTDPRRIATAWLRSNRIVAALTLPALAGLIAVAPEFVTVVLGDRWHAATPVIQVLAWIGLLQSLQGLNSSVLRAVDQTGVLLRYSAIVLGGSLAAWIAGLPFGLVGVAVAYAISSSFVEPYYTWLTCRSVGLSLLDFARSLAGVVQATALMLAAVLAVRELVTRTELPTWVRLLAMILVGVAVYVPACAWRARVVIDDARSIHAMRQQRAA